MFLIFRWGLVIALSLLSVGWLLPLYFSVDCFIEWAEREQRGALDPHGFPYLSTARYFFTAACVWVGIVVLYWSVILGWMFLVKETGRRR